MTTSLRGSGEQVVRLLEPVRREGGVPAGPSEAAVAARAAPAGPNSSRAIYNVVDDEPAPQPEWLAVLAQALGADPPAAAEMLPPPYTLEMSLRGDSNAKPKRELGWRPRYASWREGFAASPA